jgi:Nif-specific regulatory protein
MTKMESYRWPGNVRELRNIIERMTILCDSELIETWHLPPEIQQATPRSISMPLPKTWGDFKKVKQQARDAAGQELERRFVIETLQRCEGNVSKAAKDVGMQRTNLHALIRRYGITPDAAPDEK